MADITKTLLGQVPFIYTYSNSSKQNISFQFPLEQNDALMGFIACENGFGRFPNQNGEINWYIQTKGTQVNLSINTGEKKYVFSDFSYELDDKFTFLFSQPPINIETEPVSSDVQS